MGRAFQIQGTEREIFLRQGICMQREEGWDTEFLQKEVDGTEVEILETDTRNL